MTSIKTQEVQLSAFNADIMLKGVSSAMVLSPPIIGFITFVVILSGAFASLWAQQRLPARHLSDETKSLVSVSMAVVGTIAALVLGLLISNANTSFIARSGEVTTLSADILRLDQMLRLYGLEAEPARGRLLQFAERKTNDLFPDSLRDVRVDNESTYEVLQQAEQLMLELHPSDDARRWFLQQALGHAAKIGNTHWLLGQEAGQGTPKVFVALVVFWLTLRFEHQDGCSTDLSNATRGSAPLSDALGGSSPARKQFLSQAGIGG